MITRSRSNSLKNNVTPEVSTPVRRNNIHSRRLSKINSRDKNEFENIKNQENDNSLNEDPLETPKSRGSFYKKTGKSSCLGKRSRVLRTDSQKINGNDNRNECESNNFTDGKTSSVTKCNGRADSNKDSEGLCEVETVLNGSPSKIKLKRAVVLLTDCARVTSPKTNNQNEGLGNNKINCDDSKKCNKVGNENTSHIIELSSESSEMDESEEEEEELVKKSLKCKKCFTLLKHLLSHARDHGLRREEVLKNYLSPKCKALLSVNRKNGGMYSLVYGSDNEEAQSLTDLAEGCNFSEILRKFRKHSNDAVTNTKNRTSSGNSDVNRECSPDHLEILDSKDINSNTRDRTSSVSSDVIREYSPEHLQIHDSKDINSNRDRTRDRDNTRGRTLSENCDVSTECSQEHKQKSVDNISNEREKSDEESNDKITIETNNSNQETPIPCDKEEATVNSKADSDEYTSQKSIETNGVKNLDHEHESGDESAVECLEQDTLENDEVIAEEESNSSEGEEVSKNEKLCTVQKIRSKNKSDVDVFDVSTHDFQLELIRKELAKRGMINIPSKEGKESESNSKETRKLSSSSSITSSTPPKKMKHTKMNKPKDTPRESSKSISEDYIPLNVSGPTKFAVAPLDKLTPPQTHDCRNFKERMLFGNRVNRISSGELRTLKLKQKAGKSPRSNN